MAKRKELQLWTVRNASGQMLGRFRTFTADQAITRLMDDQATTASQFKSWAMPDRKGLTAKVEG